MKELTYDVVVAGSGAAGLTAAVTARLLGLSVLLVEKECLIGGTTARSAGGLWIPANLHAGRAGIGDDLQECKHYIQLEAGNRFDEERVDAFLSNAARMVEFLEHHNIAHFDVALGYPDYHSDKHGAAQEGRGIFTLPVRADCLGSELSRLAPPLPETTLKGFPIAFGPELRHFMNACRSIQSARYVARLFASFVIDNLRHGRNMRLVNGQALVASLFKSALALKIPIWTATTFDRLLIANGRVYGAETKGPAPVRLLANRGIVLATGGFPNDLARRQESYPHHPGELEHASLAPAGNVGDGLSLAHTVGAGTVKMSNAAAWAPVSRIVAKDGQSAFFPHFVDRARPGVIAVTRSGRRFTNESNSYHDFVQAMIAAREPGNPVEAFLITDHRALRRYGLGCVLPFPFSLGSHLRSGYLKKGKSIEKLANEIGVNWANLSQTITGFNECAQSGSDPEFGRGTSRYNRYYGDPHQRPNPCVAPITTPPFYSIKVEPGDLGTFEGLRTNANAQVLNDDGVCIEGLYAAGADMGSVFGGSYPGGGATLGPAMTFAFIAAHNLAGKRFS